MVRPNVFSQQQDAKELQNEAGSNPVTSREAISEWWLLTMGWR